MEEYEKNLAILFGQTPPELTTATESDFNANSIKSPPTTQNAVQSTTEPTASPQQSRLIELARKIIVEYKINREITDTIMSELIRGAGEHKPAKLLLLTAAEGLDRARGLGDQYIKELDAALTANGY